MDVDVSGAYLTPKQASERISVTEHTLCAWRRRSKGPRFIRRGGRVYYAVAALDEWYKNGEPD